MLNIDKLLNRVDAVITKRSNSILMNSIEDLKKLYLDTLRAWKSEVRLLLSKPHVEGKPNTSLWPQLRTGALRKSLSYRSHMVIRKKSPRSVVYRVNIIWDKDPQGSYGKGPTGVDYGELLNSGSRFAGKSFFGWKDRTYDLLQKRIKQSLK